MSEKVTSEHKPETTDEQELCLTVGELVVWDGSVKTLLPSVYVNAANGTTFKQIAEEACKITKFVMIERKRGVK